MTTLHTTPRSVDLIVGERLRKARKERSISQTDLANRIGLTFQQVQKYERGSNRVSASRMVDIARALGVPPRYFVDGLDDDDAPIAAPISLDARVAIFIQSHEMDQLARHLGALPTEVRKPLIKGFLATIAAVRALQIASVRA